MSEPRCDRETAEHEFARFIEAMHLGRRMSRPRSPDANAAVENAKENVTRSIQDGLVEINEKGEAVFRPESSPDNPITFHLPKGKALMAQDTRRDGETIAKFYAQLAQMTGELSGRFENMPAYDVEIAQDIWLLFFG